MTNKSVLPKILVLIVRGLHIGVTLMDVANLLVAVVVVVVPERDHFPMVVNLVPGPLVQIVIKPDAARLARHAAPKFTKFSIAVQLI